VAISTTNARVMVTVSREQDELLAALAEFQGRSKGSYLRELLDGAESMLRSLVPVLKLHAETVERQPVAVRDVVAKVLTGAYGTEAGDLLSSLEAIADRVEAERTTASGASEERTASPSPDTSSSMRS
jgi:hypothetical protein